VGLRHPACLLNSDAADGYRAGISETIQTEWLKAERLASSQR
jgi:hypothetical protein